MPCPMKFFDDQADEKRMLFSPDIQPVDQAGLASVDFDFACPGLAPAVQDDRFAHGGQRASGENDGNPVAGNVEEDAVPAVPGVGLLDGRAKRAFRLAGPVAVDGGPGVAHAVVRVRVRRVPRGIDGLHDQGQLVRVVVDDRVRRISQAVAVFVAALVIGPEVSAQVGSPHDVGAVAFFRVPRVGLVAKPFESHVHEAFEGAEKIVVDDVRLGPVSGIQIRPRASCWWYFPGRCCP